MKSCAVLKHSFDKQFNRTVNDQMADILMFASNEFRADIMRITISTLEIKYFKQNAAHFVISTRPVPVSLRVIVSNRVTSVT